MSIESWLFFSSIAFIATTTPGPAVLYGDDSYDAVRACALNTDHPGKYLRPFSHVALLGSWPQHAYSLFRNDIYRRPTTSRSVHAAGDDLHESFFSLPDDIFHRHSQDQAVHPSVAVRKNDRADFWRYFYRGWCCACDNYGEIVYSATPVYQCD